VAFWSLVAFLTAIYIANIAGPPPPSAHAVAVVTLFMWLFVPWAVWIDRNSLLRSSVDRVGRS
jgi:hypothetical protein